MSNLAVIIGRKGSKRIKNKNFKNFHGKMVIEWSLDTAEKTNLFDEIIISTDKKKKNIQNRKINKFIKFERPKKFSNDYSSTHDAVIHSIEWFIKKFYKPDYVCCLYACSPLIDYKNLIKAYKKIKSNQWNFVTSATKYQYPIERSFTINIDKSIKMNQPRNYHKRTQMFVDSYHDAGQFYWGKVNSWLNKKKFFDSNSTIQEIESSRVLDIDNMDDWKKAELIFSNITNE